MASNTRANWKLCALLIVSAFICVTCLDDSYYEYNLEQSFSNWNREPKLKLLSKRQTTDLTKDKTKQALLLKEAKTQTDELSENSSNLKTGVSASGSQVAVVDDQAASNTTVSTAIAPVTTTAPSVTEQTTLQVNLTVQDFDGNNVTVTNKTEDHHRYYNSTTYSDPEEGKKYWVDFNNLNNVSTHDMLSQSHRRAATIPLSFDFPFYGHLVRNITIATGGFLYTGDYVHSWLAATQYIAPLMANFDTSMSNSSTIKYVDNGTAFIVQWERVSLQDRISVGNFTFQVTLNNNGDIVFAYKDVPVSVTSIGDEAHPVKVGVSDAYIIDRTIFFVRRKTIYEYHKVEFKKEDVKSGTAIYFTALPTCVSQKDCDTCISNTIGFECVWCTLTERCSDGMDRHRQEWLVKGCDRLSIDDTKNCSASAKVDPAPLPSVIDTTAATSPRPVTLPSETSTKSSSDDPIPSRVHNATVATPSSTTEMPPSQSSVKTDESLAVTTNSPENLPIDPHAVNRDSNEDHETSSMSSVVGILFLVAMIVGGGGWIFYAYRNPHTPSGQCFIRYRPSQWRWRSGEAHYTAAAIHM